MPVQILLSQQFLTANIVLTSILLIQTWTAIFSRRYPKKFTRVVPYGLTLFTTCSLVKQIRCACAPRLFRARFRSNRAQHSGTEQGWDELTCGSIWIFRSLWYLVGWICELGLAFVYGVGMLCLSIEYVGREFVRISFKNPEICSALKICWWNNVSALYLRVTYFHSATSLIRTRCVRAPRLY